MGGTSPLLSQTAAGRRPRGKPWESQPEGGRRFTSHPDRRPTERYEPRPSATGAHIQVGDSFRAAQKAEDYSMRPGTTEGFISVTSWIDR